MGAPEWVPPFEGIGDVEEVRRTSRTRVLNVPNLTFSTNLFSILFISVAKMKENYGTDCIRIALGSSCHYKSVKELYSDRLRCWPEQPKMSVIFFKAAKLFVNRWLNECAKRAPNDFDLVTELHFYL
jgi:hypothetical protein